MNWPDAPPARLERATVCLEVPCLLSHPFAACHTSSHSSCSPCPMMCLRTTACANSQRRATRLLAHCWLALPIASTEDSLSREVTSVTEKLGTPIALRTLAAAVPDPKIADLTQDEVRILAVMLSECISSRVTSSDMRRLSAVPTHCRPSPPCGWRLTHRDR